MGSNSSHTLELAASAAGGASIVLLLLWREGKRKQRVREGIRRCFQEQGREAAGASQQIDTGSRKPPSEDLLRGKVGGQGRGVESQGELAAGRDLTHEDGGEKQGTLP